MSHDLSGLKAVIVDWAGTVIDHGCQAPVAVVQRVFADAGVTLSEAEARGPMGLAKRDHIAAIADSPRVAAAWVARHGTPIGTADIDRLHAAFEPLTVAAVADHATLVPGAAQALDDCRAGRLAIGSTTGYTRAVMEVLLPLARAQGLSPDAVLMTGDTPAGRPAPYMIWAALTRLHVWPAARAIKIDDTPVGIAEGRNAGCWTIGVSETGNLMGLSQAALAALSHADRRARRDAAERALRDAGAHLVIPSIAALLPALAALAGRARRGDCP